MVRILGQENHVHIMITENRVVGIKEWNYLVKTCGCYFTDDEKPLVVEVCGGTKVSPLVKRAFSIFQSSFNRTVILIA